MRTNNGNGTATHRAKLEPALNQEVRVKLLKDKPYTGDNSVGKYFLYSVVNTETGEELAFFAPDYIHDIIAEKHLGKDSEFILKKVPFQNGSKISSKLELSLVKVAEPLPVSSQTDGLKEILLQCVKDAAEVIRSSGVQLGNDELQKLATTLFIQRAKNA
jgi:hypothetical protein